MECQTDPRTVQKTKSATLVIVLITVLNALFSAPIFARLDTTLGQCSFAQFVRKTDCHSCERDLLQLITGLDQPTHWNVWAFAPKEKLNPKIVGEIFQTDNLATNFILVNPQTGMALLPGTKQTMPLHEFLEHLNFRARFAGVSDPTMFPFDIRVFSTEKFIYEVERGKNNYPPGHKLHNLSAFERQLQSVYTPILSSSLEEIIAGVYRWSQRYSSTTVLDQKAQMILDSPRRMSPGVDRLSSEIVSDLPVEADHETAALSALYGSQKALEEMQRELAGETSLIATDTEAKRIVFDVGIHPQAAIAILPEELRILVTDSLNKIIGKYKIRGDAILGELGPNATLQEYLQVAQYVNRSAVKDLAALLATIPTTAEYENLRTLIEASRQRIRVRFTDRPAQNRYNTYAHLTTANPEVQKVVRTIVSQIANLTAELQIALRLPQLRSSGTRIFDLPEWQEIMSRPYGRQVAHSLLQEETLTRVEIDAVFKNGNAWAEIKDYGQNTRINSTGWGEVKAQARRLVRAKERMQSQGLLNPNHEIYYFFTRGISPDAAEELRALGVDHVEFINQTDHSF